MTIIKGAVAGAENPKGDPHGFIHFCDATGRDKLFIRGGGASFDLPLNEVDGLVEQIYEKAGAREIEAVLMPEAFDAEQARACAYYYARRAAEMIEQEAVNSRRQEARDQLVKDFFLRVKGVGIGFLAPAHYREYEETCRFFDTDPYDTPEAR